MSVIFGVRQAAAKLATSDELYQMSAATRRYAPDGTYVYRANRVGLGLQPFHTHARSKLHIRPEVDAIGNAVALDGRLDNHENLRHCLDIEAGMCSDAFIVLAAFRRWGEDCFSHLIGEWAVALWSANDDHVYLARDHAGARTLYFSIAGGILRWSTYLETLVSGEKRQDISRDYLLRYITGAPTDSLTPYQRIEAVAPGQYIVVSDSHIARRHHWSCSEQPMIRCQSDAEYMDRFVTLLAQSVDRRTGPGAKIIAHLSGGMDSTSIVCMSDHLRKSRNPSAALLDTISFFDDSEPSWNEKPYFSRVEARRGRVGTHIRSNCFQHTFIPAGGGHGTYLFPGADSSTLAWESVLKSAIADCGYRVILSGIGGDEVLGGVPDPLPELASLLLAGQFTGLLSKSIDWCLTRKTALVNLVFRTLWFTTNIYLRPAAAYAVTTPSWLRAGDSSSIADLTEDTVTLRGERNRSPIALCNRLAWRSALNTLPSLFPEFLTRYEYRYPLIDRDLVEYAFSIPRDQWVRPGRRRYLMRRALADIVPSEVLERKRKGFVVRSPLASLREASQDGRPALRGTMAAEFGLIDQQKFKAALELVLGGEHVDSMVAILRTINVELWLQAALCTSPSPRTDIRYESALKP
jgi:asparagine synthase (glutamine-hydrolysing)